MNFSLNLPVAHPLRLRSFRHTIAVTSAVLLAACSQPPSGPLDKLGADPSLTMNTSAGRPTPLLGVQQGPGCTGTGRIPQFAAWLGREPDLMLDYLDDRSWLHLTQTEWWTGCWKKAGRRPALSISMLPRAGGDTLALGASGAYDEYFRTIATKLVAAGYGDLILRIGWEFNAEWFTWRAAADPTNWVLYWRRIVTAMRSVPGANFRFDWSTAHGTRQIDPALVYPGDAYVDIIGMDIYNVSWRYKTDPVARWNELLTAPNGLEWLRKFAALHGKPISFSEWGTGTNASGTGGGDDAFFINQMAAFIRANNVIYHTYWDETSSFNAKLSNGLQPAAGAAYRENFGPQSGYAVPASAPAAAPTTK
ncbi:glycosyl hydrolase [Uliginosibacterium sp. H3]|uniref:Glycosyl hydrolase n=1 Tax=Uliginosibacterium silvisoli TaxID=3114758 RepID=A0ABU6K880_9RHOO|nr:glycosyl hydrolase [Uliginosibacterium sp. H3]